MLDHPRAVLTCYPAIVRPLSPPEPLGNAGGLSGAMLWRFDSGRGPLVMRCWPIDGPGRSELDRIHRWLHRAASLGFIPVPLAGLDGSTVQEHAGHFWEVAPWLRGEAEPDRPPPLPRLRSAMVALAAFHQTLGSEQTIGPSPGLQDRLGETAVLIAKGFRSLERALDQSHEELAQTLARRWLRLARQVAPGLLVELRRACSRAVPLQPCLRDARPEHWLFDGDRVSGLVDFGAMGVETVAADLSRLLSEWIGSDSARRNEALRAYETLRPLDPAEIALIDIFETSSALLGPAHWIRWRFLEERQFEDPSAVAAGIERGLNRLAPLTPFSTP